MTAPGGDTIAHELRARTRPRQPPRPMPTGRMLSRMRPSRLARVGPTRHARHLAFTTACGLLATLPLGAQSAGSTAPPNAPPNAPAVFERTDSTLVVRYDGRVLLDGRLVVRGDAPAVSVLTDTNAGVVTQLLKITARGRGASLKLAATLSSSGESFATEAEPAEDSRPVVRHAVGNADNLRNRGLYDRQRDWLLTVDEPARVRVRALGVGDTVSRYELAADGAELTVRFRPRYYQRHRGLARFEPWTYRPWPHSVAGWTSWYAFRDKVTEADIHRTADVMRDVLRPFGFTYLQIDDGFQQVPIGTPDHWLQANAKFPAGLPALRQAISDRGLEPGIWTNVSFAMRDSALAHPEWFVRDETGQPAQGNWVGYVMDGSNPATLAALITPVYDSLRTMGWSYFKLDALRHLRYEGYNSFAGFFDRRGLDREQVFRDMVAHVRSRIGLDRYLLACWGIRPELIGLVDGMRVGDDGFGYGAFAQYNSFNNVVWRNDPDHIELRQPDRYRATTLTSITGSVMMVTDPPDVYRTAQVNAALRTAPVLFTRPGQVYDVDPSRSALLGTVENTVSGSGPRSFDADQRQLVPLHLLDIARDFERWSVVVRTGGDADIPLVDLGLPNGTDFVGFEFWTRRSLGIVRDTLHAGAVHPHYQVQAICLRPRADHPQLLATNRHVTCGGVDLHNVQWEARTLRGTSDVVANDPYELYVSTPSGFGVPIIVAEGARVASQRVQGDVRVVRLLSARGGRIAWTIRYPALGNR